MTGAFMQDERLVDLMIRRSIEGLDEPGTAELCTRAGRYPDFDDDAIDRIAAALTLSVIELLPLPGSLRSRLDANAEAWLAEHR